MFVFYRRCTLIQDKRIGSKESSVIEFIKSNSPELMNQIVESKGSLLFFDQRQFSNVEYLKDGDVFICSDKNTIATAQNIISVVGKEISIKKFSDFKK